MLRVCNLGCRGVVDLSFIDVACRKNVGHEHVQDAVVQFLDEALVQAVKVNLRVGWLKRQ